MSGELTFIGVVEHVAFEAGKPVAAILSSRRPYDVWLRRLAVWLARQVGGLTAGEVQAGLGRRFDASTQDIVDAKRLHRDDPEFRRFAMVIACALGAVR